MDVLDGEFVMIFRENLLVFNFLKKNDWFFIFFFSISFELNMKVMRRKEMIISLSGFCVYYILF